MMDLNHLPVLSRLTMPLIARSLRSGRISFKRGGASLHDELWKDNLGFIASLLFLSSPVHVCLLQIRHWLSLLSYYLPTRGITSTRQLDGWRQSKNSENTKSFY